MDFSKLTKETINNMSAQQGLKVLEGFRSESHNAMEINKALLFDILNDNNE